MFNNFSKLIFCTLLLLLGLNASAQNIKLDSQTNVHSCKSIVVYNNSRQHIRGGQIHWKYVFADGSESYGETPMMGGAPSGSNSSPLMTYDAYAMSKCPTTRYQFQVVNSRFW